MFVYLAAEDQREFDGAADESVPFNSAWRRATSSEAISCRFGEVLVCVKKASLNVASWASQQSSFTMMLGTRRKQDSDLCVEVVA